jgi:hypothetical protein
MAARCWGKLAAGSRTFGEVAVKLPWPANARGKRSSDLRSDPWSYVSAPSCCDLNELLSGGLNKAGGEMDWSARARRLEDDGEGNDILENRVSRQLSRPLGPWVQLVRYVIKA